MKCMFLAALAATAALALANGGVALADNTATDSAGAVQVAPTSISPTATAGGTSASAPASVGSGGDNTASGSTGAVQVGGGNAANGSTGTTQVGQNNVAASASGQSGTEAARVTTSLGTSGGNSSNGSTGVVQVGAIQGTTTGASSGPAGSQSLTVPFGLGTSGANSANGSTGTIQFGGGTGSGSTTAAGLMSWPPSSDSSASRGRVGAQPAAGRSGVAGQAAAAGGPAAVPIMQALRQAVAGGFLPFTGRSLLLWTALGLGVGLLGFASRARAAI